MKAVLTRMAPEIPSIDLMHDAPRFAPQAASYLLAALKPRFKPGDIVVGVVDPGVGNPDRRPIALHADGVWFIGPDNGLFAIVAKRTYAPDWYDILWRPHRISATFHGRDLFAPIAARVAKGEACADILAPALDRHPVGSNWPSEHAEVVYIDSFGNAMTGLRAESLAAGSQISVGDRVFRFANTFSDVGVGDTAWLRNSYGLAELMINQGSVAMALELKIGTPVQVIKPY